MHTAYINIGSNLGNRAALLEQAVAGVSRLSEGRVDVSPAIETEPWGFDSPHPFLNVGMLITTSLEPQQLLKALQAVERAISDAPHRNADGSYRDRAVDIDLIFLDDCQIDTPELTLPHPRWKERLFVTEPLRWLVEHRPDASDSMMRKVSEI